MKKKTQTILSLVVFLILLLTVFVSPGFSEGAAADGEQKQAVEQKEYEGPVEVSAESLMQMPEKMEEQKALPPADFIEKNDNISAGETPKPVTEETAVKEPDGETPAPAAEPTPDSTAPAVTDTPMQRPVAKNSPTPIVSIENGQLKGDVYHIALDSGKIVGELQYYSLSSRKNRLYYSLNDGAKKILTIPDNEDLARPKLSNDWYIIQVPFVIYLSKYEKAEGQNYDLAFFQREGDNYFPIMTKEISIIPQAEIVVDNVVFPDDETLRVTVKNRVSGMLTLSVLPPEAAFSDEEAQEPEADAPEKDEMDENGEKADQAAPNEARVLEATVIDGTAELTNLSSLKLQANEVLEITYQNDEIAEAPVSIELTVGPSPIHVQLPEEKTGVFPRESNIIQLQLFCEAGRMAIVSLTDVEGNTIDGAQKNTYLKQSNWSIPYSQLKQAKKIVCQYRGLDKKWEYTVALQETDKAEATENAAEKEADIIIIRLPEPAFDEILIKEDSKVISGKNADVNRELTLLIDDAETDMVAEVEADGSFLFRFGENHVFRVGQTLAVQTKDDFENIFKTEPLIVQSAEIKAISLQLEAPEKGLYEMDSRYYLNNEKLPALTLSGTAHMNRTLKLQADGVEINSLLTDAEGQWKAELSIKNMDEGEHQVSVSYAEHPEVPSAELHFVIDNTASDIIVGTGLTDGVQRLNATGEAYAAFRLFADDEQQGAPVQADKEGKAVLDAAESLSPNTVVRIEMTDLAGNTSSWSGTVQHGQLFMSVSGEKTWEDKPLVSSVYQASITVQGSKNSDVEVYALLNGKNDPASRLLLASETIREDRVSKKITIDLNQLRNHFGEEAQEIALLAVYADKASDEEAAGALYYDPVCLLFCEEFTEKSLEAKSASNFTLSGVSEQGAQVSLFIENDLLQKTVAGEEGRFTFGKLDANKLKGKKTFTITAQDQAGNENKLGPVTKIFPPTLPQFVFLFAGVLLFAISMFGYISAKKTLRKKEKHFSTDTVHLD